MRKYINYLRGVHVTRNKKGTRYRFTFHFPNSVIFHSDKSRYTKKELKDINTNPNYPLNQHYKESYSVKPQKDAKTR